ncbi:MAG: DsbA family oxidoreductase [Roseiflexaceae bacterium]
MQPLTVEIWSDIVCPWCYIGEHRFESALARFAHRDQVKVIRRSFQLDPSTPRNSQERVIDMLSSKYGVSPAEASRMEQRVAGLAAAEGLPMRSDRFVANTFDAHRLLHLAAAHGRQDELMALLFAGHFANQQAIGDQATLLQIATEAGLDPAEVQRVLGSDAYADAVRADLQRAAMFGIRGVPFFVLDEQLGVSGGQEQAVFLNALEQAWAAANPLKLIDTSTDDSMICEDGSCAVAPANISARR